MAYPFSDLILFSDIDGTVANMPNPILARNLQAIERFTQKGGRFALATGRSIESARKFTRMLPVNAPCLLFNGGAAYDYGKEQLLYRKVLAGTCCAYAQKVLSSFPDTITVLLSKDAMHCVSGMKKIRQFVDVGGQVLIEDTPDAVSGEFFKLLFVTDERDNAELREFIAAQNWPDICMTQSSPRFIEMMPPGVNKGTGLLQLIKQLGIPVEQTVCIGDYYNDYQMLATAGFSATLSTSPDSIKQVCDLIVRDYEQGALADLIEYLETKL